MKVFINNIIPNLKNASNKLNSKAILKNQQWVLVDEAGITTTTYIFRSNNELLIVVDGDVTVGFWEYITIDKLLIKIGDQILMYRNHFVDDKLLALKKDGALSFNVFLNEKVIDEFLNNSTKIESYLNKVYTITPNKTEVEEEMTSTHDQVSLGTSPFTKIFFIIMILILYI